MMPWMVAPSAVAMAMAKAGASTLVKARCSTPSLDFVAVSAQPLAISFAAAFSGVMVTSMPAMQ